MGKFLDKITKGRGEYVYLVRGTDRGKPAWHYVQVDKLKLPLFLKKIDSGTIDVKDFGVIIFSGWGKDPPEDIVEKIKNSEY